jgi:phage terminase large subunit GpA-like protein
MFEPPPDMLVSEWAQANRFLPKGTTARPGLYVAEKFQKIIQDAICDPEVSRVSCKKSTQVGWTEILLNICGYFIDVNPKPMMLVFVRDSDAKDKSKKVVAPMIAECPSLSEKVRENKSREGGNTQQLKQFDGGFLKIAGANSAANLRSDPCAVILLDEADGYPLDVDGEGDPVVLAERRTDTFDDAKILIGSTPAKPKGISRIDQEYEAGNQTMFHLPCPLCGKFQALLWRDPETKEYNVVWDKGADGAPLPETVRYRCKYCRGLIEERHKQRMLDQVIAVARYPDRKSHVSFYINALYAPWKPIWHLLAKEWHEAQEVPEKMRAFINLRLGETWDEGAEAVETSALAARRKAYHSDPEVRVPEDCGVLVASVDVQQNRLEAQITGFGVGEQQWLIDHEVFYGSPLDKPNQRGQEDIVNVWSELDAYLLKTWKHAKGAELRPAITLIDTGYAADSCYDFILPRQSAARRVYACKGQDRLPKLGLAHETKVKDRTIRLFNIATHACKDRILSRLKINKPGPAYFNFPNWVSEEYFDQLTAESKVPIKNKRTGRIRFEWVANQQRNEALDLTVYAHAGLWILQKFIDPVTYNDLSAIVAEVQKGANPTTLARAVGRRVLSRGIGS